MIDLFAGLSLRVCGAFVAVVVAVSMVVDAGRSPAVAQGAPGRTKAIVGADDIAARAAVESLGGRVVAERGAYAVYSVPASTARTSLPQRISLRPDFDQIRLRRGVVTARSVIGGTPIIDAGLKLVQFAAPPVDADLVALRASGALIVHYVAQNAYIVWAPTPQIAASIGDLAASDPAIQHYSRFEPAYAIAPALDARAASAEPVEVVIQLFNHGPGLEADLKAVAALAGESISDVSPALHGRYLNLRAQVRGSEIASLATIASVVNVEPWVERRLFGERQGQLVAGNTSGGGAAPSGPGYRAWLASKSFPTTPASYPVVAVVDDGVDNGTGSPDTDEFYESGSSANPSRMVFSVIPPGSSAPGPEGPDGHGHINASIIGGYNDQTGAAHEDAAGFNYGLGMNPYARMGNVRIFAPNFDVGTSDATMVDDYYARGARISSNSWGADTAGDYDVDSQTYDSLTRDAQTTVGGNQEMLFVFAAGNAGPGASTVGSPASAKNIVAVAAGETSNPDATAGDGCGDVITDGDDARDMAGFSSRGPAIDGRIRPDVSAPGTFIQGNASQPLFNGSGVCGAAGNDGNLPGDDAVFPPGTIYTWSSGTSHSTPAIAGAASLVTEYLGRIYGHASPSPALLKAYLIHVGRHMTGSGANEDLPGNNQGFGIPDLGLAFDDSVQRTIVDQSDTFDNSGESTILVGQVADAGAPVRIALVWTDAPGPTVGDAFVNDLDLTVDVGGQVYRGNNMSAGLSQTGGTADTRNNSEGVFLSAGTNGPLTITVTATTIGGDGVPGSGDATDQDYALVAYNFTDVLPAGTVTLDQQVYSCAATIAVTVADSDLAGTGTTTVTMTTTGGDSETLTLSETGGGSGVFSGSIATIAGSAVTSSGTIETADGETATAAYNDADDGSGSAAVKQDTATLDCAPPAIANVASGTVTGTTAQVTFDTDEDALGTVRFGTSCASLSGSSSEQGAGSTSHSIVATGLQPLTTYFYVVDSVDPVGNAGTDDNGGLCYSFATTERDDAYTEQFDTNDNDLDNLMLILIPDGSGTFYAPCPASVDSFATSPSGGQPLALGDDDAVEVQLTGGETVSLYGIAYGTVYVGSNGYVSFGSPDSAHIEDLPGHFSQPRISMLYDDLDPSTAGTVRTQQLADRLAITYSNVPEFAQVTSNSFQLEMFFNGVIRMTWLGIDAGDGIVGLSAGLGVPPGFVESDLDAFAACPVATCSATPLAGCLGAGKVSVQLRDNPDDSKDRLKWRWSKGEATAFADFGSPDITTSYALCLYDSSASVDSLAAELSIPAGVFWDVKSTGFNYKDRDGLSDGVTKMKLKEGAAGKAKISVQGKGNLVPMPTPVGGGQFLSADPRVTVQLINDETGVCWTGEYDGASAKKNSEDQFKATAP